MELRGLWRRGADHYPGGTAVSQDEDWGLRGQENLSQGLLTFGNTAEGQEAQEVDLNRGVMAPRERRTRMERTWESSNS